MAGPLAADLAPSALALFHAALVHAGPAVAWLQVLVAALIKALLWVGLGGLSEPLLPAHGRRPAAPPPGSPVPQSWPVKAAGQVQWYDSGSCVLEHEPPWRQGPEAQGSRGAGHTRDGGGCLRAPQASGPQPAPRRFPLAKSLPPSRYPF